MWLTEEQIEHIAGIAADKAAEKSADLAVKKLTDDAYKAIGKGVVNKFLVIVGVLTAAAYLYAQQKGWVK